MTLKKIKFIKFTVNITTNGSLFVIEPPDKIPFKIRRIFFVTAKKNDIRGKHAHKKCSQFLICLNGEVQIDCTDGNKTKSFFLKQKNVGLLIPPGIWASQKYLFNNSVLAVICDQAYDSKDYIRNYDDYKVYSNRFIIKKRNI